MDGSRRCRDDIAGSRVVVGTFKKSVEEGLGNAVSQAEEGSDDGAAMAVVPADVGIGDEGGAEIGRILPAEVER